MELHEYLHDSRVSMGMSILCLSKATKISTSHISRIERGERNPSPQTLERIAGALDIDYRDLLKRADLLSKGTGTFFDLQLVLNAEHLYDNDIKITKEKQAELLLLLNSTDKKTAPSR